MKFKLIAELADNVYKPAKKLNKVRFAVRALCFNAKGEIAIIHIKGKDNFGKKNYYELPGGGIEENETPEVALIREMKEELGVRVKTIQNLGVVTYNFNLLGLKTIAYCYACSVKGNSKNKWTKVEQAQIDEIIWLKPSALKKLLTSTKVKNVGKIIHKRELLVLKEWEKLNKSI
jgi:8-oxo-dGTP pyrophosphatase MutT (NUDIX family)